MGTQPKLYSLYESACNIVAGATISLILYTFAYPEASLKTNIHVALILTVFSLLRSYSIRRAFNAWAMKKYEKT